MAVIDMRAMMYINLLDRVARVRTFKCFLHNNTIFFAVKKEEVSKAIGVAATNTRKIQERLGRKVRIVGEPEGIEDAKRFIEDIVSPIKIKSLEIKDKIMMITAGSNTNKAALIGRNKRRFEELKKIVQDFFNLDLKIL